MSIYNPSIPQPTDKLSASQPQLLQNFTKANSSFGIDHYAFADLTANNGKHNQITTPAYVANPPTGLPPTTAANEPKIYAFQDSAPLGVINYSRGPSDAVPTPLTNLQSPSTAIVLASGATTNILDFSGLTRAMALLYAADFGNFAGSRLVSAIFWTGALNTFLITNLNISPGASLTAQNSGNILQLKNNSGGAFNDIFWTLEFLRTS